MCLCFLVDFGEHSGVLWHVHLCAWLFGFYGCLLADLVIVWKNIVYVFVWQGWCFACLLLIIVLFCMCCWIDLIYFDVCLLLLLFDCFTGGLCL